MQATDDSAAPNVTERRELLDIAVAAADAAGTIISERANDASSIPWQLKMHADFVTEVDTAAERAIRDTVFARIPDAHVLGEELSPDTAPSGITFVVDPLDGTTNFVHRYPVYAVSIAAAVDGIVEAAVILDVPHGDRYTAIRGGGAFRNGVPIAVSTIGDPTRALVGTGFPFKHLVHVDTYQRQFAAVVRTTSGIRRAGAAALDLAVAAAIEGDLAAVLEAGLGGDVDDAGGLQPVLGRQGAGDQVDVPGQARA